MDDLVEDCAKALFALHFPSDNWNECKGWHAHFRLQVTTAFDRIKSEENAKKGWRLENVIQPGKDEGWEG